jgi:hypothetical protein
MDITLFLVVKPCSLLFMYQCSRFTTPKTQFHCHIWSTPLRGQTRKQLFGLLVNNNIIGKHENFCNITRHSEKVLEPTVPLEAPYFLNHLLPTYPSSLFY